MFRSLISISSRALNTRIREGWLWAKKFKNWLLVPQNLPVIVCIKISRSWKFQPSSLILKGWLRDIRFWKYNAKSLFLTFLNTDRNAPEKRIRIVIWTFSLQICFQNQFSTLGSGQTENTQIHVFAYSQFDHFPKSKIYSESRFEIRMFILPF